MRGLSTKGNLRFKIDWANLISGINLPLLLCFTLYLRAIFLVQAPGGLYLEERSNEGFFALPAWGAYIWRGLYMEVLIFGILGYLLKNRTDHLNSYQVKVIYARRVKVK